MSKWFRQYIKTYVTLKISGVFSLQKSRDLTRFKNNQTSPYILTIPSYGPDFIKIQKQSWGYLRYKIYVIDSKGGLVFFLSGSFPPAQIFLDGVENQGHLIFFSASFKIKINII